MRTLPVTPRCTVTIPAVRFCGPTRSVLCWPKLPDILIPELPLHPLIMKFVCAANRKLFTNIAFRCLPVRPRVYANGHARPQLPTNSELRVWFS